MRASCRTPLRPQVATAHQDLPVSKSPPPGHCVCQTLALRTQGWFEAALLSIAARPPAFLLEQLQTNARGLLWAADAVLGDADGDVLLVIDQFEELFTLCLLYTSDAADE